MSDYLHSTFRLDDGNEVELRWGQSRRHVDRYLEVFVWGYGYAGDVWRGIGHTWRVERFNDRVRDAARLFHTEKEAAQFLAEWLVYYKNKMLEESQ